jgi:hypothetical protein
VGESQLKLSGNGQSKLKLSGKGNECKPLPHEAREVAELVPRALHDRRELLGHHFRHVRDAVRAQQVIHRLRRERRGRERGRRGMGKGGYAD